MFEAVDFTEFSWCGKFSTGHGENLAFETVIGITSEQVLDESFQNVDFNIFICRG